MSDSYNPMGSSPSGSSVHGILQARTGVDCHSLFQRIFPIQGLNLGLLHCWQILYHLSYREELACPSRFSCVRLFEILWTRACQAPLSTGFSRQEYWSGLPCPSTGGSIILGTFNRHKIKRKHISFRMDLELQDLLHASGGV